MGGLLLEKFKSFLFFSSLIVIPLYTWKRLYDTYIALKKDYDEQLLFLHRHNCVIMYAKGLGFSGWPNQTDNDKTYKQRIKLDKCTFRQFLEPYLYFVNTSKRSLNIAIMSISTSAFINVLVEASRRGVKVRMIVNYDSIGDALVYRNLMREGVLLAFYISKTSNKSSIMHYKYMLKDCDNSGGFLCMGSLNMSDASVLNNFEDMVFSTEPYLVEAFSKNFEHCWGMIDNANQDVYNRTVLSDSNLVL